MINESPMDFDTPWKDVVESYFPEFMADDQFWSTLQKFDEVQTMPYITSFERKAIQRGKEEGLQKGLGTLLIFRFGSLPQQVIEQIARIESVKELEALIQVALRAESLESFISQMPTI